MIYNHPIGSIYHLYIANWVIIYITNHLLREPGSSPLKEMGPILFNGTSSIIDPIVQLAHLEITFKLLRVDGNCQPTPSVFLHPWDDGIFTLHEKLIFMVKVGKYTSPMDGQGWFISRDHKAGCF